MYTYTCGYTYNTTQYACIHAYTKVYIPIHIYLHIRKYVHNTYFSPKNTYCVRIVHKIRTLKINTCKYVHVKLLMFTHQDAETRVKSLQTPGVLEPFTLVRHAQVPNARRFEKAMHIYFRDLRVYKRKEFFVVDADEINSFFDIVENKVEGNTDETEQWQYALQKAK